jgi:glycerol uptake facilitator-like aquaporin
MPTLGRRVAVEALSTWLLLSAIVGSGIMAERIAGGNGALVLLANSIATGAALVTLILTFGPLSGAHMNPAVTFAFLTRNNVGESVAYVVAQIVGAVAGTATANLMFSLPTVFSSHQPRWGGAAFLSEVVATFGLVLVIRVCKQTRPDMVAFVVGGYITAAYWFTSSTSFANPAVTVARSLTDTFTGIRLSEVPAFVVAQLGGAALAVLLVRWLIRDPPEVSPHD